MGTGSPKRPWGAEPVGSIVLGKHLLQTSGCGLMAGSVDPQPVYKPRHLRLASPDRLAIKGLLLNSCSQDPVGYLESLRSKKMVVVF